MTFTTALPKWPAFCVEGRTVTQKQAQEILIRTSDLYFSTNDKDFLRQIYDFLGQPTDEFGYPKDLDRLREILEKYRILHLSFLKNSRIISSFIGGPHGWCDWDGRIGCNTFNIGKYPSVEEVHEDWKKIAEAFPYLDLRCQLWNCEAGCEDSVMDPRPVVEYLVKDGKVEILAPTLPYIPHAQLNKYVFETGERGCTFEQFQAALEVVCPKNKLFY